MRLDKYSIGTGDRFGMEAEAQLGAAVRALDDGLRLSVVWNKSHREHVIIGSSPADVRKAADRAVEAVNWHGSYFVDADHITMDNVDMFMDSSDFFTLDVADYIGRKADSSDISGFVSRFGRFCGFFEVEGIASGFTVTPEFLETVASKYLYAVREAGKLYRHIEERKGRGTFIAEISMDETVSPQTPMELYFILGAIAEEGIPVQTIAPKFTGRFNKGVDYDGDIGRFEKEFTEDLKVIAQAVREFGLPEDLKLSIHSGSDKFSIYPVIKKALAAQDSGLHIKTAGTTWLEELIGLAESGGDGFLAAKTIYGEAYGRYDELTAPYADVIDINRTVLPMPSEVEKWTSERYVAALRHDLTNPLYDRNFRQLLHVAYKVAAEMGDEFTGLLESCRAAIAGNVEENLYRRHIKAVFPG